MCIQFKQCNVQCIHVCQGRPTVFDFETPALMHTSDEPALENREGWTQRATLCLNLMLCLWLLILIKREGIFYLYAFDEVFRSPSSIVSLSERLSHSGSSPVGICGHCNTAVFYSSLWIWPSMMLAFTGIKESHSIKDERSGLLIQWSGSPPQFSSRVRFLRKAIWS